MQAHSTLCVTYSMEIDKLKVAVQDKMQAENGLESITQWTIMR